MPDNPPERGMVRPNRKRLLAVAAILAAVLLGFMVTEASGVTSLVSRFSGLISDFVGPKDDHLKLVAVYATDPEENNFLRGAQMAVDRINATDEGILGRKLDMELVSEQAFTEDTPLETTVEKTLSLAGKVARTKNLLAVIGHEWSDTAITASSIYSRNDILYFATHATAEALTNHDFSTVFALQPDNSANAEVIANYALKEGFRRFIVLSDKTDYGKESANFFTAAVTKAGGKLVFRGYLSTLRQSTEQLLMFILDNKLFQRSDFDAFFVVSSSVSETADFIKNARSLGLDVPILGMEYLFSAAIEKTVGKKGMRDVMGVSIYDRDNISKRGKDFLSDYRKEYGHAPDLEAALGYDVVTLIRDATKRAGTLNPNKVADTLKVARYKTPFVGVTGPLLFDRNGLIADTQVFIVRHDGNEFRTVASYEIPENWDNIFEDSGQLDDVTDTSSSATQPPAEEMTGQ